MSRSPIVFVGLAAVAGIIALTGSAIATLASVAFGVLLVAAGVAWVLSLARGKARPATTKAPSDA